MKTQQTLLEDQKSNSATVLTSVHHTETEVWNQVFQTYVWTEKETFQLVKTQQTLNISVTRVKNAAQNGKTRLMPCHQYASLILWQLYL